MKRSEMLWKLKKAIMSVVTIEDKQLVFNPDIIAEKVLLTVERNKMLPPLIETESNPDELVFQWEKE